MRARIGFLLWAAAAVSLSAQLRTPQTSPKASVSQTIGITDIGISYHRPGVNNRKIWGNLVPYNQIWRVGANENTTISFSTPVKIEGNDLPAGTYGFHAIPGEQEWTIIFNKVSNAWGSYFYDQKDDALRIKVKPETEDMAERLFFSFRNLTTNSVLVVMNWEKLKVGFTVSVDVPNTVVAGFREELRGNSWWNWQTVMSAANYCFRNKVNSDEAMKWIDRSISLNENFNNLSLKAQMVEAAGHKAEADKILEKAVTMAVSEGDVNALGRLYVNQKKFKEAIEAFKRNVKDHPNSWSSYDRLADAYEQSGDKKSAIENYQKALKLFNDDDVDIRKRIEDSVKKLSEGK
jgi:hypothetical protein